MTAGSRLMLVTLAAAVVLLGVAVLLALLWNHQPELIPIPIPTTTGPV